MEPLLYFAINLTIEIAKVRNVEAIDYLLSTLDVSLTDKDFEIYFDQVSTYLEKNCPDDFEWLLQYLETDVEEDVEEDVDSNSLLTESFTKSFTDSFTEAYKLFKVFPEDIIHLLLDEGFSSEHYELINEKLYISSVAKSFLSSHYDLEYIESFIGEKKDA